MTVGAGLGTGRGSGIATGGVAGAVMRAGAVAVLRLARGAALRLAGAGALRAGAFFAAVFLAAVLLRAGAALRAAFFAVLRPVRFRAAGAARRLRDAAFLLDWRAAPLLSRETFRFCFLAFFVAAIGCPPLDAYGDANAAGVERSMALRAMPRTGHAQPSCATT